MASGPGSFRASTPRRPDAPTSDLAPCPLLGPWRPRVVGDRPDRDRGLDAGARDDAPSARSRRRRWGPVELETELTVDPGDPLAIDLGKGQGVPGQPSLKMRVAFRLRCERALQVAPPLSRGCGAVSNRERKEPGDRLRRRGPRSGLPLLPLLGQPPTRPVVHERVLQSRGLPGLGLAGCLIEPFARLDRLQEQHPVALCLRSRAKRLAPLSPVDRPSHDPRQLRLDSRAPVLNAEHPDLLDGSSHDDRLPIGDPPSASHVVTTWEDCGKGSPDGPEPGS